MGFMKRWPEICVPKPMGFEFARAKKSTVTDLQKPVTNIMSMTVLSQVFFVPSWQCHMLSQATVTGFVDTVKGFSQLYLSSLRVMDHPNVIRSDYFHGGRANNFQ